MKPIGERSGAGNANDCGIDSIFSNLSKSTASLSNIIPVHKPNLTRGISSSSGGWSEHSSLESLGKFQFPDISRDLMEKLDAYFVQNAQVLLFGSVCGVAIGAAVTTGLGLGILSAKTVPLWCGNLFTSVKKYIKSVISADSKIEDSEKAVEGRDVSTTSSLIERKTSTIILKESTKESKIILIQGLPFMNHQRNEIISDPEHQCDDSLNMINLALGKNSMTWSNVARLSVYLVEGKCNPGLFRARLKEFPFSGMLSIIFVHRLEDETAVVQLEALAYGC